MGLRYKGAPDRGANKIADSVLSVCFCKFIAVGVAMNSVECSVHEIRQYPCEEQGCSCGDYRPNAVKRSTAHWPRCVCGHIAQMHN